MWLMCLIISVILAALAIVSAIIAHLVSMKCSKSLNPLIFLLGGFVLSACFMFFPIHRSSAGDLAWNVGQALCLSVFNAMQVLGLGCEYGIVVEGFQACPTEIIEIYKFWVSFIYFLLIRLQLTMSQFQSSLLSTLLHYHDQFL